VPRATDTRARATGPPAVGQTGGMRALEVLHQSDQHLIRTVDSLSGEDWAAASLLPGWTRAHVVAHLALNAEGLAAALDGAARGESVPVYRSPEARDEDIEELAGTSPAELRHRLFAGTALFREAVDSLPEPLQGSVERVPGGPVFAVAEVVPTRRREVEVHHADLAAGYTHRDWPPDFVVELLDVVTRDHRDSPDSPGFTTHATDLDLGWDVGAESPVVSGAGADLGWWLVGRGSGEGLHSAGGPVPTLGPWRRTTGPTRAR
jgi:maleylpyruvate isomerase